MTNNKKNIKYGGHRKPSNNILNTNIDNLHNININNKGNYINIGTHNVRGFNLETKQAEFFDEYTNLNLDIIGFTETKLTEKQSRYTQINNKKYKSWWTG